MGKMKKAKKFAQKKRLINPNDSRIKKNEDKQKEKEKKKLDSLKNKVHQNLEIKEL